MARIGDARGSSKNQKLDQIGRNDIELTDTMNKIQQAGAYIGSYDSSSDKRHQGRKFEKTH